MRFSVVTLLTAAFAGLTLSAPSNVQSRSLVTDIGQTVAQIEDGLGVSELEEALDGLLGNSLSKLEGALGVTFAEYLLGLSKEGAAPGVIQAVGEAVAMIESGLHIDVVDAWLDSVTGGAVTSLEETLGVTDIEKALGITQS